MARMIKNKFREMHSLIASFAKPCLIACAVKYNIVDHLMEKQMNCEELSVATKTNEGCLKRLLEGLVSIEILHKTEENIYLVTKLGETLKSGNQSLKHFAMMMLDYPYNACGNLPLMLVNGEIPFAKVFGKNFYDYVEEDSKREDVFARSMMEMSNICYSSFAPVYDFSTFRRIVDIGGGNGEFLRLILSDNKDAKGVLLEIPSLIEKYKQSLKNEFGDRIEAVAGDFTKSVPADGDLYILKLVMLNCDDEKALKILTNIREKMKANSKILIIDFFKENASIVGIDITMMALFNGKCRSVDEHKKLLSNANLRYNRLIAMPDLFNDAIEATL